MAERLPSVTLTVVGGDDWERVDHTWRWVWRLDEKCAQFGIPRFGETPDEYQERIWEIAKIVQRELHLRREQGCRELRDWQLADMLQECRRKRTMLTGVGEVIENG